MKIEYNISTLFSRDSFVQIATFASSREWGLSETVRYLVYCGFKYLETQAPDQEVFE